MSIWIHESLHLLPHVAVPGEGWWGQTQVVVQVEGEWAFGAHRGQRLVGVVNC